MRTIKRICSIFLMISFMVACLPSLCLGAAMPVFTPILDIRDGGFEGVSMISGLVVGYPTYYSQGQIISTLPTNADINVKLDVSSTSASQKATVIVALYDGDSLLDTSLQSYDFSVADVINKFDLPIHIPEVIADGKLKTFVWKDMGTIQSCAYVAEMGKNVWCMSSPFSLIGPGKRSGSGVLRLMGDGSGGEMSETITVSPNKNYEILFDAKGTSAFNYKVTDMNGTVLGTEMNFVSHTGTYYNGWYGCRLIFASGNNTQVKFVMTSAGSTGTTFIDDMAFYERPSYNLISDGDFEKSNYPIIQYAAATAPARVPWEGYAYADPQASIITGTDAYNGRTLRIKNLNSYMGVQQEFSNSLRLKSGGTYVLQFMAKGQTASTTSRFNAVVKTKLNGGSETELANVWFKSTDTYTKVYKEFTVPALTSVEGARVYFQFNDKITNGDMFIDDVVISLKSELPLP